MHFSHARRASLSLFPLLSAVSSGTHAVGSVYQRGEPVARHIRIPEGLDEDADRSSGGSFAWRSRRRGKRERERELARHEVQKCHRAIFRPARMWGRSTCGRAGRDGGRAKEVNGALAEHHVLGTERRDHRLAAGARRGNRAEGPRDRGAATVHARAPRTAISRTVGLTVRWPAPPPPRSHSWSRGESRRPICFVTANARLLLLLLRIGPSRCLLRRRRPFFVRRF